MEVVLIRWTVGGDALSDDFLPKNSRPERLERKEAETDEAALLRWLASNEVN